VTPPFVLIVGRGRSGTTLLQAMLDAHPDMAIPPESHLLVGLIQRRGRYEARGGFHVDRFLADLEPHYGFRRWDLPSAAVATELRHGPPADTADAARRLWRCYARRHGKSRYGDKTPINVMHIPSLARFLPEARFVHIIRDGRDVTLSYLEQSFGAESLLEAAYRWRRDVRTGRRDGAALGAGRYLEIRYETLVEDPERVLPELCDFVDLSFDPRMLEYSRHRGRVLAPKIRPAHERLALPPTKGLRDWRRDMRPQDLATFEAVAGDLLSELGYERAVPRPSAATALAARVGLLRVHARRAVWRLRGHRHKRGAAERPAGTGVSAG
jgi:hypothetical protein